MFYLKMNKYYRELYGMYNLRNIIVVLFMARNFNNFIIIFESSPCSKTACKFCNNSHNVKTMLLTNFCYLFIFCSTCFISKTIQ